MLINAKLVIQIHLCDLVQVVVASVSGGQHVCCTGEWISAPDHHMVHMSASFLKMTVLEQFIMSLNLLVFFMLQTLPVEYEKLKFCFI